MEISLFKKSDSQEVIQLFVSVFSASENEVEGQITGDLVRNLMTTTNEEDLIGFVAVTKERIVGCIFFSHFIVPGDKLAFILSPVAIATGEQRSGIGQQLINYGLNHLRSLNVNLVFTYGDLNYYSKTGFFHISENIVKAPFKLSQPKGWLAQSLDGQAIEEMQGHSKCVTALSDQKYW